MKGIVKQTHDGRTMIAIKREAVKNLFLSAVNSRDGWIDFKAFSRTVSHAGKYYAEKTLLIKRLLKKYEMKQINS